MWSFKRGPPVRAQQDMTTMHSVTTSPDSCKARKMWHLYEVWAQRNRQAAARAHSRMCTDTQEARASTTAGKLP